MRISDWSSDVCSSDLFSDAYPRPSHVRAGADGLSKSGDRYQASLAWLDEPLVPHPERVHQMIVAGVVDLQRPVQLAGAFVLQIFGEAPRHRVHHAFAGVLTNDEAGATLPHVAGAGICRFRAPRLEVRGNLADRSLERDLIAH